MPIKIKDFLFGIITSLLTHLLRYSSGLPIFGSIIAKNLPTGVINSLRIILFAFRVKKQCLHFQAKWAHLHASLDSEVR